MKRTLGIVFVWSAVAALYGFRKGYDQGHEAGMLAMDWPKSEAGWVPTSLDLWTELRRAERIEATDPRRAI